MKVKADRRETEREKEAAGTCARHFPWIQPEGATDSVSLEETIHESRRRRFLALFVTDFVCCINSNRHNFQRLFHSVHLQTMSSSRKRSYSKHLSPDQMSYSSSLKKTPKQPVPVKKDYRSSDAKWRCNLKASFRLIQTVATPDRGSVCGKNVRKILLDQAYQTIVGIESNLREKGLNVDDIRTAFKELESKLKEEIPDNEFQDEVDQDIDVDRKKKIRQGDCKDSSSPLSVRCLHPVQGSQDRSQRSHIEGATNLSMSSLEDPLKQDSMASFDQLILTSTPRQKILPEVSKTQVFHKKRSLGNKAKTTARRKLDLDSAVNVSPVSASSLSSPNKMIASSGEWFVGRLEDYVTFGQLLPPNVVHSCEVIRAGGDIPASHFAVQLTELTPVDEQTVVFTHIHPTEEDVSLVSSQSTTGSISDLIIFPSPLKGSQGKEGSQNKSQARSSSGSIDQEVVEEFLTSEGSFRVCY